MGDEVAFETERLVVRSWLPQDAPRALEIFGDPEVSRWTSAPAPMASVEEALERIEGKWSQRWPDHPGLGTWAIVPKDVGLASGSVLLRPLADTEAVEIGWSLHRSLWGQGFATEASRGALDRAREHGHHEVIAIMWPDNERSAAVAARIGMADLGVVPDRWYGTPEEPDSRMFTWRWHG